MILFNTIIEIFDLPNFKLIIFLKAFIKPIQEIKKFWKRVIKEADLENVRVHDLRHTYASHLVSKGLSLSIVGKLLGHTQAATTQRYAHLADEPLRQATDMFGDNVESMSRKKSSGA